MTVSHFVHLAYNRHLMNINYDDDDYFILSKNQSQLAIIQGEKTFILVQKFFMIWSYFNLLSLFSRDGPKKGEGRVGEEEQQCPG